MNLTLALTQATWAEWVQTVLVVTYAATLCAIALHGLHRYILVYLYCKHRNNVYTPKGTYIDLPKITIQLPMFNEDRVAERVIRATCQVDYPLDKLQIQVLDDSTDHSADIARKAVEEWAAKGYPIVYIHRKKRDGYKAGALEAGLKSATGEFIAIFDADFIPPRTILQDVVNYFVDDKIGMVQVRWDHLNRKASLLTRTQAIFLDGHFVIEHTARNRSGRFMHFNGTAGVWRRSTIDDAGGWEHDTLTEDRDLSYRAQMKGWQFVYLPEVCAPAELPPDIVSFVQQQHRWTKGIMQTCLKLLPKILKSKTLHRHVKVEAFLDLMSPMIYPLMVFLTLLIYPAFFGYFDGIEAPFKGMPWGRFIFTISLFILATCSASTFFIFGQRELFGRVAGWKTVLYLPLLMGLGVGVGLNNAKAVIEALWGAIRRKESEFIRTPKYGTTGETRHRVRAQSNMLTPKRLAMPLVAIAFGVYMVVCIGIAIWYSFGLTTVPFLVIFAGGYFYVGFSSLATLHRMQREAEDIQAEPEVLST